MPKTDLKNECIRLRIKDRLSIGEIVKKTGAARGSLSAWLRPYPLTTEEKKAKIIGAKVGKIPWKKPREPVVNHSVISPSSEMSREEKGHLAEMAVAWKMSRNKLTVYKPLSNSAIDDWVVRNDKGCYASIQVRWVLKCGGKNHGLPVISLQRMTGHSLKVRYTEKEFDFIIGYDYQSDIAYVYSVSDVSKHKFTISIRPEAAERWDKIIAFNGRRQADDIS